MVGKYVQIRDSYLSLHEALMHGRLKRPHARQYPLRRIHRYRAAGTTCSRGGRILVPGGFGERGIEGKIQAVRYAREQGGRTWGSASACRWRSLEFGRHCWGCGCQQHRINLPALTR